jgi:hypothetical protein
MSKGMSMNKTNPDIANLTPYQDVNAILIFFVEGVLSIFKENLTGIYLTGSLSYQAFEYKTSDIDLTVILQNPVSAHELEAIRRFHIQVEGIFSKWASRLECSYTPIEMLASILPPKKPRPWYWGGDRILYAEAPYGNEWITNNYLLYQHAIPLVGPEFKELTGPIAIEEVQKACVRDLFTEWEPKKADPGWPQDSHHASYLVLNLCRILYTVMCQKTGSKKTAALWAICKYGEPWSGLIQTALDWHAGVDFDIRQKAFEWIDFVIDQVSKTALYAEWAYEIKTRPA